MANEKLNHKLFWWEQGYKNMEVSTMGYPNHDIVELSVGLPKNAKILDLGCGEGRNSLFLASQGHNVTAVDRSEAGIRKLESLALEAGYTIKTVVADIRNFDIDTYYHVIMSHGVIDYLENNEWRRLLSKIKDMTLPGGYNAYTCMIFNDEYPALPEFTNSGFKFCLAQNELGEFYKDWGIVRYDYYVKWDQHPSIPIHCHPLEKIISRKPGSNIKKPIVEQVPINVSSFDATKFEKIYMGISTDELIKIYGNPDTIDSYSMDGIQFGVANDITLNNAPIAMWYYGMSWIYVLNNKVWGKSISLKAHPIRVKFPPK